MKRGGGYISPKTAKTRTIRALASALGLSEKNQEKMMEAYTSNNAKQLRAYGLPDTEEYLSMAHAVGPKGAKKLIDAQNAGKGNLNSLDVLGLKGPAAETNPQLNTNVDTTIAALKGGGPMGHGGSTMLAKNKSKLFEESFNFEINVV